VELFWIIFNAIAPTPVLTDLRSLVESTNAILGPRRYVAFHWLENYMTNEIKSGNMNQQGSSGKNEPNRTTDAPKSGQQLQGTAPQNDKGSTQQVGSDQKSGQQSQGAAPQTDRNATQQGGSDHKSGQQSQGGSQKDNDGTRQAGSTSIANDPKKAVETENKGTASK
jgi:hypothetical protein